MYVGRVSERIFSFLECILLYKVYKLERPQRQGVESCRILSRPGSVKHLK